jgi:sRNA-binding protein
LVHPRRQRVFAPECPEFSHGTIKRALSLWCERPEYLKSFAPQVICIDLDGNIPTISEWEIAHAQRQLARVAAAALAPEEVP